MASAFVQSKSVAAAPSSSPTITMTGAPTSGNVLVAFIYVSGSETTIDISGWSQGTQQSTASTACRAFWKVSNGSEQTITGSLTTSRAYVMAVMEISGVNNTTPSIGETSSANISGTKTTGSVTPTSSRAGHAVCFRGTNSNSAASAETVVTTNVGTVTEREDRAGTASVAAWEASITSTSGSYSGSWTESVNAANCGAIVILQDSASITGAAAEPIIVTYVAAGIRKTFGVVARGQVFTYVAAGIRKTFGVVARPQVFTIHAAGVRKTFGVIARPQVFTTTVAGVRKTFGVAARPETFTTTVAGVRTTLGVVTEPIVLSYTAAGVVTGGGGTPHEPGSVGFISAVSRGALAKASAGELAGSSLGGVS